MSSLHIAFISPFQKRLLRGIERAVWNTAEGIYRQGNSVDILTWSASSPVDWGAASSGIKIRSMPHLRYYMGYWATPYYVFQILRHNYDFIVICFPDYGEVNALHIVRQLRQQKYIITFHYPYSATPQRFMRFQNHNIIQEASDVVGVSSAVAQDIRKYHRRDNVVIGNGVDVQCFSPSAEARKQMRQHYGLAEESPLIVTVAALEERKGIQWVIRALPELVGEFPDLEYWVLGEGPYHNELVKEVERLGLERHVTLLGNQPDVERYLAAADIGCLLSYNEAQGIAVLEYMAMQLPVVTSQHPPFSEFIRSDYGMMIDETDSFSVAKTLRNLLCDPEKRYEMGKAGREEVMANHTWDRVASLYLDLFRRHKR